MVSGWEKGHVFPSANYLIKIAKVLDISLDYLLLGKNDNQKEIHVDSYKDAIECVLALHDSGLYKFQSMLLDKDYEGTDLLSWDQTMLKFYKEWIKLEEARSVIDENVFKEQLNRLANNYDTKIK